MKKGWQWPVGIVVFLGLVVTANVIFISIAVNDPSFAVEKNYYEKGLHWDDAMAQGRTNEALGWRLAVDLVPGQAGGDPVVVAHLTDGAGAPLDGASIDVEAFHGARAANVLTAHFTPGTGHTYAAPMPVRRAGLWEFHFTVARDGKTFTETVTKELGRR